MREILQMSKKEANQIAIFDALVNKKMTKKEASNLIKLSIRQIIRKKKRFEKLGVKGLIHKGRGKKGNRSINEEIKKMIIELLQEKYVDYGPTLAAEKLYEYEQIKIDHETLRRLMIQNDLWQQRKKKRKVFVWRERKHHAGEMVLVDGSKHIW
jgi:transposase